MRMEVGRAPLLVAAAILAIGPVRAHAGNGIISVNQHETVQDNGCTYCPDGNAFCPEGCPNDGSSDCRYDQASDYAAGSEMPPYASIANQPAGSNVDVFSYHVNPWRSSGGVLRRWRGRFCQALAEYDFKDRPKILSTDMRYVEADGSGDDVAFYLGLVCDDAAEGSRAGRTHFEHFDRYIDARSQQGHCISSWGHFDQFSRNAINAISSASCDVDHFPNGTLTRGAITPGGFSKLHFSRPRATQNPNPVTTLKGFGYMGALAAGERLDATKYFRILAWKKVNLTRVWAVEQWTGLVPEPDLCASENEPEGPTPFDGTMGSYELDTPNSTFYSRLREFAQAAADRGVVVQFSLYDVHGLLNYGQACWDGRFHDSPYNLDNNTTSPGYIGASPSDCACSQLGEEPAPLQGEMDRTSPCEAPHGFVQHAGLQANHLVFVRRVAEEVGGMGNVMFEIINEAVAGLDWTATTPTNAAWQSQQAENLRKALPIRVARDAFNDDWTSGSNRDFPLAGRKPDRGVSGTDTWTASNVQIMQARDLVNDGGTTISTDNWLGYATSAGQASSMSASLPFGEPKDWTSLNVRAQLEASAGSLQIGVSKPYGESLHLELSAEKGTLQLWEVGGGCLAFCDHGTISVSDPTGAHEVRLKLVRQTGPQLLATVYLDGAETSLANIPLELNSQSGSLTHAFFAGSGDFGVPYPVNTGKVDSFEAAYTCLSCAANTGDNWADSGDGVGE